MLGHADQHDVMTLASLVRTGDPATATGLVDRRAAAPAWVGQLLRFGVVGGGASVLQLATYAFLADSIGSQPANIVSWLVSTLAATELHRRFSFGGSRSGTESDHVIGMVTSLVTLLLSAVALTALNDPSGTAGLLALVLVNGVVGGMRFVVLRWWMVGRSPRRLGTPASGAGRGR